MDKKLIKSLICGFIFVSALGSLCHFLYEWTGQNIVIALFCPVNESTWEHMKLLFFPMLLFTCFFTKKCPEYFPLLPSMLAGNLFGTFLIPVFFYTYSGILGYHISLIDILIFFLCVGIAFTYCYRHASDSFNRRKGLLYLTTLLLTVLFFLFTFFPPDIGLFAPPT